MSDNPLINMFQSRLAEAKALSEEEADKAAKKKAEDLKKRKQEGAPLRKHVQDEEDPEAALEQKQAQKEEGLKQ